MNYTVFINSTGNGRNAVASSGQLGTSMRTVVFTVNGTLPDDLTKEWVKWAMELNGWSINSVEIVDGVFADWLQISANVSTEFNDDDIKNSAYAVLAGNGIQYPQKFTIVSSSNPSSSSNGGLISPTAHGNTPAQSSGSIATQIRNTTPTNPTGATTSTTSTGSAQTTVDKFFADLFGSASSGISSAASAITPSASSFFGGLGISTPFALVGGGIVLLLLLRR